MSDPIKILEGYLDLVYTKHGSVGHRDFAAREALSTLSADNTRLRAVQAQLVEIGSGKLTHIYEGECPDYLLGFDFRDPDCPACQILLAAAAEGEK